MAQFTDFWKIITPASRKSVYNSPTVTMDDGANLNSAGYAAFSTVSWFSNMMKGSTSRLQRYKQYDAMDIGDITRALDIIAEEISNPDKRTGMCFIIDYQVEENQEIPATTSTTLRAALKHWSKFHNLNRKIFNSARCMVKYGDCIFRKTSDTKQWEFIDPTRVVGIKVNAEGKKISYIIRPSSFANTVKSNVNQENLEDCPAESIIHFTLSDDMGDSAPFGLSVLQSAFKDYQKMVMLEDAAIIYRIVRAPERRVFYIDTGNMPPHRVKQHLEQIKNDIRQKRMPNTNNANQTDSQYNPESMGEDMFFQTNGSGRGSRVETLPGGASWEIPELDYFMNKVFRALRVPTSYMRGSDNNGAQYNDGKVGIAYIEELRFANYIQRLQTNIEEVLDAEFKTYLKVTGVNIDPDIFRLVLPEPQNFALYRQAALDADLINSFSSVKDVKFLSKRFIMKRYLGLTDDDIQMNEALLIQEQGIESVQNASELRQMYDPAIYDEREAIKIQNSESPAEMSSEAPNELPTEILPK